MKCPKCNNQIVLQKGQYEKLNIWFHKFSCEECSVELTNTVVGELVRAVGFMVLIFDVLTFGGSRPIPLLEPIVSSSIVAVGFIILVVGQKMASVATVYEGS